MASERLNISPAVLKKGNEFEERLHDIELRQCVTDFELLMVGWFVGFYGISTFVVYLMPNPFLCK